MTMAYMGRSYGKRQALISYGDTPIEQAKAQHIYKALIENGYNPTIPYLGRIFVPVEDRISYDALHTLYLVWKRVKNED